MPESEPNISDLDATVAAGVAEVQPPQAANAGPVETKPIVARGGRYYRNTRYIMAVLTVVMGFWFGYDGFVRWPNENKQIEKIEADIPSLENRNPDAAGKLKDLLKNHSKHSAMDLRLQVLLAFALPPLGILLLAWALYNSRGEYRLEGEILQLPGHPPVPLAAIRELDQSHWDRKGIARISYELADGLKGTAKLDDFVYDRTPTDQIYDQIKSHLQPPGEVASGTGGPAGESTPAPASPTAPS